MGVDLEYNGCRQSDDENCLNCAENYLICKKCPEGYLDPTSNDNKCLINCSPGCVCDEGTNSDCSSCKE